MLIYRSSMQKMLHLLGIVLVLLMFVPVGWCKDYTVGAGDTLHINVFGHPDLNQTVEVNEDGFIVYPFIGQLKIQGMSVTQVSRIITGRLAAGYIVNPQVTVVMDEYRSRKASILGKVKAPALYELKGRTTLLEFISTAGGLAADAGQYAYVTRKEQKSRDSIDGRQEIIRIDLKKLMEEGDTHQNILIRDGDSVFVSNMQKIYVTGQVASTGAYPYEEGLTVIKALTNAGGLSDIASPTRIRIIRKGNGEERVLRKVKMDDPVKPEDVIVVPESFF